MKRDNSTYYIDSTIGGYRYKVTAKLVDFYRDGHDKYKYWQLNIEKCKRARKIKQELNTCESLCFIKSSYNYILNYLKDRYKDSHNIICVPIDIHKHAKKLLFKMGYEDTYLWGEQYLFKQL